MKDIIVLKKKEIIIVCFNGSKLIINKNNKLFDKLNKLSKEEIKKWYLNFHKGGE